MLVLFPFWWATLWRRSKIWRSVVIWSVIAPAVRWLCAYIVCVRVCVYGGIHVCPHKHSGTQKILPTDPKAALGTFYCCKKVSERAELSSFEQQSMSSLWGTPWHYEIKCSKNTYFANLVDPLPKAETSDFLSWYTPSELIFVFSLFFPLKNQGNSLSMVVNYLENILYSFNSLSKKGWWKVEEIISL